MIQINILIWLRLGLKGDLKTTNKKDLGIIPELHLLHQGCHVPKAFVRFVQMMMAYDIKLLILGMIL
jgi:hypothetical protein